MHDASFLPSTALDSELKSRWPSFEQTLVSWWQNDLRTALEDDVRRDPDGTLLYLPFPYSSAGGSESVYPDMYAWDTYFINLAMLEYGWFQTVKGHLLNHLFMIERYGFVLNANRTFYQGRSQPPLHADMVLRYVERTGDWGLAMRAYPLLSHEMLNYWCAEHHMTESGLHTNRDILDASMPDTGGSGVVPAQGELTSELLAEAETGLDFCANFEGDVTQFNPLITNCILIRYLEVLATLADRIAPDEKGKWVEMRNDRITLLQEYCWNKKEGFFFEYCYAQQRQGSVLSLCGFLPLWAGIATAEQAARVVEVLPRFLYSFGLCQTAGPVASPHERWDHVQWSHPAGWPPFQVLVPLALRTYGYESEAKACETAWLEGCMRLFDETGRLYEKYNVVEGILELPEERQDAIPPMHGWSSASCLLAGRNLWGSAG